jgi:hypothetical protein
MPTETKWARLSAYAKAKADPPKQWIFERLRMLVETSPEIETVHR